MISRVTVEVAAADEKVVAEAARDEIAAMKNVEVEATIVENTTRTILTIMGTETMINIGTSMEELVAAVKRESKFTVTAFLFQ